MTNTKLSPKVYGIALINHFVALSNDAVYDHRKHLDILYYVNLIPILLEIITTSDKFSEQDIINERLELTFHKGKCVTFQLIHN